MSKIKCEICGGDKLQSLVHNDVDQVFEVKKPCNNCKSTGEIEITDTMRIDFLEKNETRLLTVTKKVEKSKTVFGMVQSYYWYDVVGWTVHYRSDILPTPREAIDAAILEHYGKGGKSE